MNTAAMIAKDLQSLYPANVNHAKKSASPNTDHLATGLMKNMPTEMAITEKSEINIPKTWMPPGPSRATEGRILSDSSPMMMAS